MHGCMCTNLHGKMLANLFLCMLWESLASDVQNFGNLESLCVHVLLSQHQAVYRYGCLVIVSAVIS